MSPADEPQFISDDILDEIAVLLGVAEASRPALDGAVGPANTVRSYLCDLGPGDHGHTDCWHLSQAADIIEARDDYARRSSSAR